MQNYTNNANKWDVPLTVENVRYFNFLWDQGVCMFCLKEKQIFHEKYFYWVFCFKISSYDDNLNHELIN